MIQLSGTKTRIKIDDPAWHRGRTMFAVDCPDGVVRCVIIPNWKWNIWPRPPESSGFAKEIQFAWRFTKLFAESFDQELLFADRLAFEIDLHHRRPHYWAANENAPPDFWERRTRKRAVPWSHGNMSDEFNQK